MNIKTGILIKQSFDHSCAVAAMAMAINGNYDEMINSFKTNFQKEGLNDNEIYSYLGDIGCEIIVKYVQSYIHKDFGRKEILRPFAPSHLVKVQLWSDVSIYHWLYMDSEGILYDPLDRGDTFNRNSWQILTVAGIWKK